MFRSILEEDRRSRFARAATLGVILAGSVLPFAGMGAFAREIALGTQALREAAAAPVAPPPHVICKAVTR